MKQKFTPRFNFKSGCLVLCVRLPQHLSSGADSSFTLIAKSPHSLPFPLFPTPAAFPSHGQAVSSASTLLRGRYATLSLRNVSSFTWEKRNHHPSQLLTTKIQEIAAVDLEKQSPKTSLSILPTSHNLGNSQAHEQEWI